MNGIQKFVIVYLRGVKITYDILTPGQVGLVFGSVKIKSSRTTQEIINDVNILIDLIKQIWTANKTLSLIIWVKISYDIWSGVELCYFWLCQNKSIITTQDIININLI